MWGTVWRAGQTWPRAQKKSEIPSAVTQSTVIGGSLITQLSGYLNCLFATHSYQIKSIIKYYLKKVLYDESQWKLSPCSRSMCRIFLVLSHPSFTLRTFSTFCFIPFTISESNAKTFCCMFSFSNLGTIVPQVMNDFWPCRPIYLTPKRKSLVFKNGFPKWCFLLRGSEKRFVACSHCLHILWVVRLNLSTYFLARNQGLVQEIWKYKIWQQDGPSFHIFWSQVWSSARGVF